MPENGTSGLMSGERKRSVAAWPKLPRLSSTLPAQAGYPFEQNAPIRVDGYGKTWIILRRTDANPAASAWYDPALVAADAVGSSGSESPKPPNAEAIDAGGTDQRRESKNLSPELTPKAARRAEGLRRFPFAQSPSVA